MELRELRSEVLKVAEKPQEVLCKSCSAVTTCPGSVMRAAQPASNAKQSSQSIYIKLSAVLLRQKMHDGMFRHRFYSQDMHGDIFTHSHIDRCDLHLCASVAHRCLNSKGHHLMWDLLCIRRVLGLEWVHLQMDEQTRTCSIQAMVTCLTGMMMIWPPCKQSLWYETSGLIPDSHT